MADAVEAASAFDLVGRGDALFVNRRLDALTLSAGNRRTHPRVPLGPACMGSFALRNPLVLAYEWASLTSCRTAEPGWSRVPAAAPARCGTPRAQR